MSSTKKVTLALPSETVERLKILAEKSNLSLSAATTASIEHFYWLLEQRDIEGYEIILEKKDLGGEKSIAVALPNYKIK